MPQINFILQVRYYLLNSINYRMGNQVCCESHASPDSEVQVPIDVKVQKKQSLNQSAIKNRSSVHPVQEQPSIPPLYSTVTKTLNQHQFLNQHFQNLHNKRAKNYGSDVYEGQFNSSNRPHGYGKMYKENGSLFLGHFENGKAQGKGAYIFPDGSYYQGNFLDNQANDDNGQYYSQSLNYSGGFLHNNFHGKGVQKGPHHSFRGTYNNGKKSNGLLEWAQNNQQYSYQGHFNDDQLFDGYGVLIEPKGTYSGNFQKGLKHGKGEYKSINGLRYVGDYRDDRRNGFGIIYNQDDTIAYQGQIKDGMPHGKGSTYEKGKATQTIWDQGIDQRILKH